MALQHWFSSHLHAKVKVDDPEEGLLLQQQIDTIILELSHCEMEISRSKERENYGLIWKWKSRLEASPFILASRYGYYTAHTRPSLNLIKRRRQHLVQLLGQICAKSADLPSPMIIAQLPIRERHHLAKFFERHWLNLFVGIATALYGRHLIRQLDPLLVLEYTKDGISAVRNLLSQWIWSPLVEIWHTIRYSKSSIRITDEVTLKQDYDALNRMVLEYGKDTAGELEPADFELILKEYERNMKSPIKSALMGDLIRLILIQVQKGKVDLGGALLTLDKLMRANELNFELLTVIPVMAVLYLAGRKGLEVWREIAGRSQRHFMHQYQTCLRIISTCITDQNLSEDERYGEIIFECYKVVSIISRVESANDESVKADLTQLIDSRTPNSDRLWIVHRMHTIIKL